MDKKEHSPSSLDDRMMTMVYLIADGSKDKKTHIGALILGPDKEIRTSGYNGFVRGLNDNVPERQEKPEKDYWFEHAERNGIYNSARFGGASLKGCVMYTNGVPCMDCARAIVQSGIEEIIIDKKWEATNRGDDIEHSRRTIEMFKEVGIKIRYWDGNLVKIKKYRRGKIIDE